jgi:hypothetical protein
MRRSRKLRELRPNQEMGPPKPVFCDELYAAVLGGLILKAFGGCRRVPELTGDPVADAEALVKAARDLADDEADGKFEEGRRRGNEEGEEVGFQRGREYALGGTQIGTGLCPLDDYDFVSTIKASRRPLLEIVCR